MKIITKNNKKYRLHRFIAMAVSAVVSFALISALFSVAASAKEEIIPIDPNDVSLATGSHVYDETGSISDEQINKLEQKIAEIGNEYKCDVAFALINNLSKYAYDDEVPSIEEFSEGWFKGNAFGYGDKEGKQESRDGVLFVVSKGDRKYDLYVSGNNSMAKIITPDESDEITEELQDQLTDVMDSGKYSGFGKVFENCLAKIETQLSMNKNGVTTPMKDRVIYGLIIFGVAMVIAIIVVVSLRSKMKTIRKKQSAVDYVIPGSFDLRHQHDYYLYTTTRVIHHEDNDSHSGGGGGSSHHSSGSF